MDGESHRASQQIYPPDGADPGQWALDMYREWRTRIYGDGESPEIPEMQELLASMREEPSI